MAKTPHVKRIGTRVPAYMPTEEEIAAGCIEIREDWDENQYRKRAGVAQIGPIDVAVVGIPVAARMRLNRGFL